MKIGIEAERANLSQKTGVEVYAAQLIRHLALLDHKNDYVLYFRTKPQAWFYALPPNFKVKVIPFPKFWTQIRLSWEMLTHPVDVLLILASALPFIHPKKSIVTAHDIAFELFEGIYSGYMQHYQKFVARYAVKHAAAVIAVSESTKNDLIQVYQAKRDKIETIYLGFDPGQFTPMSYEQAQSALDKFRLTYRKYILYVGTIQPRKNIHKLIEAYLKLKEKNHIEEKLVIVGKRGWLWEPIQVRMQEAAADGVIYLDYVSQEDLRSIIAGASLLALVAFYEGFGLPPLEAMASGVPTVVSMTSALPEVVGDAGMLVDPQSVDDIARGLLDVLTNAGLRHDMIEKGLVQSQKFSWEITAKKTLELLESFK